MIFCKRLRRYKFQCVQNVMNSGGGMRIAVGVKHVILQFYPALRGIIERYSDLFLYSVIALTNYGSFDYR